MYDTMLRVYKKKHDVTLLDKAVANEWITEEEKDSIIVEVDGVTQQKPTETAEEKTTEE